MQVPLGEEDVVQRMLGRARRGRGRTAFRRSDRVPTATWTHTAADDDIAMMRRHPIQRVLLRLGMRLDRVRAVDEVEGGREMVACSGIVGTTADRRRRRRRCRDTSDSQRRRVQAAAYGGHVAISFIHSVLWKSQIQERRGLRGKKESSNERTFGV